MAKRKSKGNGSGTVYPRKNKDGKITGYIGAYYGPDGKRRYVSAKSKTECERKLRAAMADADKGLVFDAGTTTVGQYLNNWLAGIKGTVRQRTWERYEQFVRVHLVPALGGIKLGNLSRAHLKTLYASKTDLSPTTIRHLHAAMHKALDEAVADNLIARNVATNIKLPKMRKKEIHPLTPDQAKAFLEAARGDRYEPLYVLAIHYGLRRGELLGLKWSDLQGNTLQVRRTMSEARVGRIEEETKNGKGRRIELSEKALEALRSHRRQHAGVKDSEYIFPSTTGTPTNSSNLMYRSFKPTLRRAGLPQIRFHDLRHTCATIRFMKGQHPKRVQELLGHASIAMTMDIYSHVIPGMGDDNGIMDDL
jgi:integrase